MVTRGVLVLVVHRERKGGHAVRGEYFLAGARGEAGRKEDLGEAGPKEAEHDLRWGRVPEEEGEGEKRRERPGGAVRESLLHLRERGGGAVRRVGKKITVTSGLGGTSEEGAKHGKRGR